MQCSAAPAAPGSQGIWINKYRVLPKVQKAFQAGTKSLICNLLQNPSSVPLVSTYCPALLRNGKMYLLLQCGENEAERKQNRSRERYLLGPEHLQIMGIPMWPAFSGGQPFPHFGCPLTQSAMKSLAGNVLWMRLRFLLSAQCPYQYGFYGPGSSRTVVMAVFVAWHRHHICETRMTMDHGPWTMTLDQSSSLQLVKLMHHYHRPIDRVSFSQLNFKIKPLSYTRRPHLSDTRATRGPV